MELVTTKGRTPDLRSNGTDGMPPAYRPRRADPVLQALIYNASSTVSCKNAIQSDGVLFFGLQTVLLELLFIP